MTDLYMVTARKIGRDSASEFDYQESCQLISSREDLTALLQDLQKDEPHHLCRFVVEPL